MEERSLNIIPYSLRKSNTNKSLPNSILNPLINSLSPSRRSNGARLLSIRQVTLHNMTHTKINSILVWDSLFNVLCFNLEKTTRTSTTSETSKERLCSIARILPSLENLLEPLHPIRMIEYALIPSRMNSSHPDNLNLACLPVHGTTAFQISISSSIRRRVLPTSIVSWTSNKSTNALANNLIPSLTGCRTPTNLVLLGPKRIWDSPSNLRSNKVTKATLIRQHKVDSKYLNWEISTQQAFRSTTYRSKNYAVSWGYMETSNLCSFGVPALSVLGTLRFQLRGSKVDLTTVSFSW